MDANPSQAPDDADQNPRAASSPPDSNARRAIDTIRRRPLWGVVALAALVVTATLVVQRWNIPEPMAPADATAQKDAKGKDGKSKSMVPKEPFSFGSFSIRPSESTRVEAGIKPGHWTAAGLEARANFDDFRGELIADMHGPNGAVVDLDGVPFRLQAARPAILPKGQKKVLDVTLFDPVRHLGRQAAPRLTSRGGSEVWRTSELVSPLPAQQYFFVVLAREPDDYRYLVSLDSIWVPSGSSEDRGQQAHYRVVLPKVETSAPLPNHSIYWTSTAVLLWDGIDPKILTDEQQQAIVDWLHWGGRLIVSGPESLELARESFLARYLPATAGESWSLDETTLEALDSVAPTFEKKDTKGPRVAKPWTGVELRPDASDSNVLISAADGKPLVVERRVGRGGTVVSAFRLSQRELVNWPLYDSLFNSCLLHRPRRQFYRNEFENRVGVQWADREKAERQSSSEQHMLAWGYYDALDAERVSQVRYFSRDGGATPQPPNPQVDPTAPPFVSGPVVDPFASDIAIRTGPGVAAWNDESEVSTLARGTLIDAAGIQIPDSRFVLTVLGAYLLVLVPLNWAFFRWWGRVELAWVAAPLIAVVFGVLVVKWAQLDIGFARSSTEIAVLEVQGQYPRANLTRYCALYASLSSDYTVEFNDPAAVALPLPGLTDVSISSRQARDTVVLRRLPDPATGEPGVRLENLTVSSNATGLLHSEEMFAVGGALELTSPTDGSRYRLKNGTGLRLRAVTVVVGNQRAAWLDTIEPGETREFILNNIDEESAKFSEGWGNAMHHGMKLGGLGTFAVQNTAPEETRLVAWTEDLLPGITITPEASQSQHATIVVAHLNYGPPHSIEIDKSARAALPKEAERDGERSSMLPDSPEPMPMKELEIP